MDAWQIAVEHEHVVADDSGLDQRLLAVGRQVDGKSLSAQATSDGVRQAQFVFGDQYSHPLSMTAAP